ncbi:ubiquitin carboxyl-terminal hydrolase 16 isoform X2 [Melanotaenia boesemani]|uniref:ubiquitin carboxyl-terminal hydrolase 16 isoform X2 n=1 Tax=Melanotaenia boesemani TaxID=1250792 RepID=UPI001C04D202|nr:ubiquitin carboxyl-terminal hydrolase 16 isoform X2 [Melanotaenia boesemani]
MGKKRGKVKSSREDDDIDLTVPSCRHIKRGADQTLLKKLVGISDWMSCQDCKQEENKENINSSLPQDTEEKETEALWMCLKCGHRGCGRNSENKHAVKHYETPRSDPHCLVVSLDNWSVWCYMCDDEVQYSTTGHLAQLVTNLKKQITADPIKIPQKKGKEEVDVSETVQKSETVCIAESENKENKKNRSPQRKNIKKDSDGKSQNQNKTEENYGVPVKGLSNLGNTCFFNAVIQNLSQTQLLRETLNKVTEEKQSLDIKPDSSLKLEPIVVELDQPGSLTFAMCQLLSEIQETKKGVVTPRELFTQVCKKASRFKGFQQQDSQELLRYLLDGMRAEELKRVNTGIMNTLKQSSKCTDGEHLKTLAKDYEKNGLPKNFVDQVFGGEMTSTIMCQQCKTVSIVMEMFLDLSLPVSEEAYRKKNQKKVQKTSESSHEGRSSPALNNGNDDIPTGAGSKYQQKKAKKQAKKQAKHQKRQHKLEGKVTLDSLTSPSPAETQQTDATADAMDGENANIKPYEKDSLSEENPTLVNLSEQDQSIELEKEEDGDLETDCDSLATSSVSNRFTVLSAEQHSQDSLYDEMSNMDQEGEEDTLLVDKMEKVTLDDAFIEESDSVEQGTESEDDLLEAKEYTVINQDPELAFHTLATRTTPEKQESSVQSCLFQFTEVETLMQNNSLLCVTCTKRQLKEDKAGGSKKNIYTDALKQMLISSPPAVLTLHLKRFQQSGYSICKVNRHVHFPLILDIAPYCAAKCKNLPEGDAKILYSLYGIVEHSGTMRSGHYTAYVKVRPECPKASSKGLIEGDADPPRGSWFHISDTSFQPVSESKVMSCQAYLLFYERIL